MDIPINVPVTQECVIHAAHRYEIPARLLLAVLKVEGGRVGKKHFNKNGSYDMGPMQINSLWLKTLDGYVSEKQLIHNGCVNVQVGAWLLKRDINVAGNFWDGVGNYHSRTKRLHDNYVQKVYQASLEIGNEYGWTTTKSR